METDTIVILLRVGERIVMTAIIVGAAISMMFLYRKKIQNIDLEVANEAASLKTTVSLTVPIFLLLSLILYAFIILSNPISYISTSSRVEIPEDTDSKPKPTDVAFVGYGTGADNRRDLARDLHNLEVNTSRLNGLMVSDESNRIEEIRGAMDRLLAESDQLRGWRFSILESRFDASIVYACMPRFPALNQPIGKDECREFNEFLFGTD